MIYSILGYEHVIANMGYIPTAMFYGAPISVSQYILRSMIPSFIGNLIGAGVIVGCTLLYLHFTYRIGHDEQAAPPSPSPPPYVDCSDRDTLLGPDRSVSEGPRNQCGFQQNAGRTRTCRAFRANPQSAASRPLPRAHDQAGLLGPESLADKFPA